MFKYSTYSAFAKACYKSQRSGTESHLNKIKKKIEIFNEIKFILTCGWNSFTEMILKGTTL